jgi:filamentous hemagglutinin family protein
MNGARQLRRIWHVTKGVTTGILLVVMPVRDLLAGDILRRGGSSSSSSSSATSLGAGSSTGSATGVPSGQDQLARNTLALQSVQAMQAAARALAIQGANNLGADPNHPGNTLPDVPNGTLTGGLVVDSRVSTDPSLWSGASQPQQTVNGNQTLVTVVQNSSEAILNWSSFNIGKQTTLDFDQSAGGSAQSSWIAFNKVNDPSGVPSQILGSIQAPGQVYVINANGIIFGGSAQINVNTLVAASLPINDNLVSRGLLNNPDSQFLFSSLPQAAGQNGTPAFTPSTIYTPNGQPGNVEVQAGAQITTRTTADHVGGRVFLIGANVDNQGEISTPDGQTILAAGLQVGLVAHDTSDPSLRGLDAYVGAISDPQSGSAASAGTVSNEGLIDVPRGNITMAGANVNQNGFLNSTTSVSLNGRIDLLAEYNAVGGVGSAGTPGFFPTSTGLLTLGPDSVTQVVPELASDETVVGTTLALPSQINLQGLGIYLAPNSSVFAPNGSVVVKAGVWNLLDTSGNGTSIEDTLVNANGQGQIYLDADASVDVSGSTDVEVPVSENIVAVQLNAAQLADSPLLRDGPLHGQTIYVDIRDTGTYNGQAWVGTPLADASGYVGLIQRSVGELTTAGGSISMSAGESVIMQPGSKVNVSGGWINYQGGVVPVTSLVSAGQTYSTAEATPDRTYQNAVTTSEYEQGYIQGANGGAISITAPSMALDGNLVGSTVSGPRQQQQGPAPSSLSLTFQARDISTPAYLPFSPTPPSIVFQTTSDLQPADPFGVDTSGNPLPLRPDRKAEVILSPDLVDEDGFGSLSINNSDGSITLPAQTELKTVPRGSISLSSANMDIEGSIVAPGGDLQFTVYDASPYTVLLATPAPDPTRGHFTLGPSASLNVAGTVSLAYNPQAPEEIDGGTISIKSYSADLEQGSTINASGGVSTSGSNTRTYGKGGSISISAGQDPSPDLVGLIGGQLVLDSSMQAYSGAKAGSLSIQAPSVQIGGTTSDADTLFLSPDFFGDGGFGSFTITSLGALSIAPNTVIAPEAQSWTAVVNSEGVATLVPFLAPQALRTPVSLTFGASGVSDHFSGQLLVQGDLAMGEGAVIQTDPEATVSLRGQTVAVLGSVFAPGGVINISGASDSTSLFAGDPENQLGALPTVDLGPQSVLSASGTTLLTPNAQGYRTGSVLPGGRITVSGNIVAEAGAVLDVSGTSDVLDEATGYLGAKVSGQKSTSGEYLVPTRIDSDGGSIVLAGAQELITDATLKGAAGGPTATGGSLTISSGRFYSPQVGAGSEIPLDVTLAVSQQDAGLSSAFYPAGETAIGHPVLDSNGQLIPGFGHFAADDFQSGGFDSLTLKGTVEFQGPVSITANRSITLADAGVIYADSSVYLTAPYISVGMPFQAPQQASQIQTPFQNGEGKPFLFSPTYGSGNLNLQATTLIDIGDLSLQNIGQASFVVNGGDIRGDGTLEMAGNLTLSAGQIYPPTDVGFTIAAFDYTVNTTIQLGSVTIEGGGDRQLPLSAGGTLSVYASEINQDGVLRAPLGAIQLGWDGTGNGPVDLISGATFASTKDLTLGDDSVTSVSAIDPISGKAFVIPYGIDVNGTSWIDPTGTDITDGGVAQKSIQLSGANITVKSGAQIDIRGGGNLYAYRWVSGNGGTEDILGSSSSFAIVPTYELNYAPYAPYNPSPVQSGVFGSDAGYVNNNLVVGDQIYLQASRGLPAGTYTLLPARYALLPGAFLVTPISGMPLNTKSTLPDGSSLVSGYMVNSLDQNRITQPLTAEFEVSSSEVVQSRAEYDDFYANTTLSQAAASGGFTTPRLPIDAGQLVLSATETMALDGKVMAQAGTGGQGGLVDISSPEDILIGTATTPEQTGVLVLDASELSSFDAESLLIGGVRETDATGTKVTVQTDNVTVDNSGSPLTAPDVILVANHQLTLAPGADVEASGMLSGNAETILLGDSTVAGSGNGVLLRVSADSSATTSRSGVDSSTQPVLTIGAGAQIAGASVVIDSTGQTTLDPSATLKGSSVSIASGQISLALTDPGSLQSVGGLILSGTALQSLQSDAQSLSLVSYSSLDTYGTGQIGDGALANLAIHAADIRGFNQNGGTVEFAAQNILLDNGANGTSPGPVTGASGTLVLNAGVIELGANQYRVDQFSQLTLNATRGVLLQGSGGLTTPGNLSIVTPVITGATAADQAIRASGNLTINSSPSSSSATSPSAGLGAQLTLDGATITDNGNILLPSGSLRMEATAGDVVIGNTSASQIDVGGVAKTFYDQVEYTDGGQVSLLSDLGSVVLNAGSVVNVSAQTLGGNAGSVTVSAPNGTFTLSGTLSGNGGVGGQDGTFQLDVGTLPSASLGSLDAALNVDGFTESRSIRVRNGNVLVDGLATAHTFDLSADNGTITVTGTIDASGATGGTIDLAASGSVILQQNSLLTVAGQKFDDAGKGGSVSLAAGQEINGNINRNAVVDIHAGSTIDLSVAANSAASAAAGDFTGTLHLRAPQTADNLDLQINPINGTIVSASQIIVEGYELFNLNNAAGATITSTVEQNVYNNGTTFAGNTAAIMNRLFANNTALESVAEIRPGAEIINPSGDLIMDTTWDLSTYRFGPESVPGMLTLRAAGNLDFNYNASSGQFASLSDGFSGASYSAALLPAGKESWSYQLVAGADFGAANSLQVLPLSQLGANAGSLLLGNNAQLKGAIPNSTQPAQSIIPQYYQTIRTGTGDIDISAGRDIQLLSPLATIYTAGAQAPTLSDFDLPNTAYPAGTVLGAIQYSTPYPAQYSFRGGNVTLSAQNDIIRYQVDSSGQLSEDSSKELPTNWLYRRGYIDPTTGEFGITHNGGEIESTSWWVDFSNFFEDIGALGGGNVTLTAGHDVSNVDAVIPTNARMPKGTPDASVLVELGGGDLLVVAGNDINGGVYYVERGQGTLRAGNSILTNPTRAALDETTLQTLEIENEVPDSTTWLPTTLFLGDGSFTIEAGGNALLGPVANPFLLPQGINNSFYDKSYFSTYSPNDAVSVSSLTGSITLKDYADPGSDGSAGSLANWYENVLLYTGNSDSFASESEPWLRINETQATLPSFATVEALIPATVRATAFSGDINVVGSLTLSPSPTGTLDVMAAGSINGLQPNDLDPSTHDYAWGSSQIDVSDADPNRLPSVTSPLSLSYLGSAATSFQEVAAWSKPSVELVDAVFENVDVMFDESGSYEGTFGVLQTQEALHAPGLLHADDANPVHVYALDGNISGITLFTPKATRVVAGGDIADIALYLQNVAASDVSVVSAGGDIIAYDPDSQLRAAAQTGNNELLLSSYGQPAAGDIQINGPGTLEVLAGRNLDLGVGPNAPDGTAVGISSIGNARNPNLPFAGADIIAAAGIGGSGGLDQSALDFQSFITAFLDPTTANGYATRYLPDLGTLLGLPTGSDPSDIWNQFTRLPTEQQDRLALDIFYLALRDAGRDHNTASSPGFGNYDAGFAAIADLFPTTSPWQGNISLTSREIKTTSGGDISLLVPGGQLLVGVDLVGNQPVDQGIFTEDGGNISIFARDSVVVGTSRIFTLRGGNVIIWSSDGDIAAGASSKTVQSAPPTRVLIDPQNGDVETDLAGLATGGGIGVLTTVAGVAPSDVDLVAPAGSIDAGDAGIRVSGNLNLAALQVLNVGNIEVQGSSVGVPVLTLALNATSLQAGEASAAATTTAMGNVFGQAPESLAPQEEIHSLITVEVLGYGGGDAGDQDSNDAANSGVTN